MAFDSLFLKRISELTSDELKLITKYQRVLAAKEKAQNLAAKAENRINELIAEIEARRAQLADATEKAAKAEAKMQEVVAELEGLSA